jgi:hypothetical protein
MLAFAVHVASIIGIDAEAIFPQVWLLHYAIFPVVVLAVLAARVATSDCRLSLRTLLTLVPLPLRVLIGLTLAYAIADFVWLVPQSGGGDPIIRDGHFYVNDHGTIRELSEDAFHRERSVVLRLYSGVWVYLYLFAASLLLLLRPYTPN